MLLNRIVPNHWEAEVNIKRKHGMCSESEIHPYYRGRAPRTFSTLSLEKENIHSRHVREHLAKKRLVSASLHRPDSPDESPAPYSRSRTQLTGQKSGCERLPSIRIGGARRVHRSRALRRKIAAVARQARLIPHGLVHPRLCLAAHHASCLV